MRLSSRPLRPVETWGLVLMLTEACGQLRCYLWHSFEFFLWSSYMLSDICRYGRDFLPLHILSPLCCFFAEHKLLEFLRSCCQFLLLFPRHLESFSQSLCRCQDLKIFSLCFPVTASKFEVLHQSHWSIWNWFLHGARDRDLGSSFQCGYPVSLHLHWRVCLFFSTCFWPLAQKSGGSKKLYGLV